MPTKARGCGQRVVGGIYAETNLSENGKPIEDFIVDPPVKVDVEAMGLAKIGVSLRPRGGVDKDNVVYDVWDRVGGAHYPNVADFIEEVRSMGASRRLPSTLDFARLSPRSRLILVHDRASIKNAASMRRTEWDEDRNPLAVPRFCPKHLDNHIVPVIEVEAGEVLATVGNPEMCAGLWYHDVEGGDRLHDPDKWPRAIERKMPGGFSYLASHPVDGFTRDYAPAIFLTLPVHTIAVIHGKNGEHENAMLRTLGAGLPITLEEE